MRMANKRSKVTTPKGNTPNQAMVVKNGDPDLDIALSTQDMYKIKPANSRKN